MDVIGSGYELSSGCIAGHSRISDYTVVCGLFVCFYMAENCMVAATAMSGTCLAECLVSLSDIWADYCVAQVQIWWAKCTLTERQTHMF